MRFVYLVWEFHRDFQERTLLHVCSNLETANKYVDEGSTYDEHGIKLYIEMVELEETEHDAT